MRRVARRPCEGMSLALPPRPPFFEVRYAEWLNFVDLICSLIIIQDNNPELCAEILASSHMTFCIPGIRRRDPQQSHSAPTSSDFSSPQHSEESLPAATTPAATAEVVVPAALYKVALLLTVLCTK